MFPQQLKLDLKLDKVETIFFFTIALQAIHACLISVSFKHILLARTVDIIKQMLIILNLQGLEWK